MRVARHAILILAFAEVSPLDLLLTSAAFFSEKVLVLCKFHDAPECGNMVQVIYIWVIYKVGLYQI